MKKIRQRMYLLAFAALVLLFAGCKGESPTSPTPTTGGGTGGVTPPTTASVTVTVSNATPLVDSTTVVTATVTVNNSPAANGTAVEFKTTLGTFTDANAPLTIRTTTGGVATATLTSSTAGTATVTATVANVAKTVQATFSLAPVTPPTPDTTAAITSITPTIGRPAGGDIVTINGKNFVAPVRVLFDYGSGVTKEAQVVSVSATQIQVVSPSVDLGTGQTKDATIILINNVGSPNEVRVTGPKFTYQATVLTPKITTLSPASGPIDGGTRVTIFGEGFQAPVQVFFGSAEAQVINVTFSQIIVMSPTARDTATGGSGTVTGPVSVKIININSATTVTATDAFRYTPKMQITAAGPTEGVYTGGTRVTIDGIGFNDPVAVSIGGVAAQPIKVSGTEVIAITSPVSLTACSDVKGAISVTNVDNGDTATFPGLDFIYRVPKSVIVGVSPTTVTAGGTITVRVANTFGIPRLTLGTTALSITSAVTDPVTNITTFTAVVPTLGLTFTPLPCSSVPGVSSQQPTAFPVTYTSATLTCFTDTLPNGLIVNPAPVPVLALSPTTGFSAFLAKFTAATCTTTGTPPVTTCTASASITAAPTQTVLIANSGTAPLVINSVTNTCSTEFSIVAPAAATSVTPCNAAPLAIGYNGPPITNPNGTSLSAATGGALSSQSCTVSILTNAGNATLVVSGNTQ
jgi:IPT/TIG domain